jgi:hypothetical protein
MFHTKLFENSVKSTIEAYNPPKHVGQGLNDYYYIETKFGAKQLIGLAAIEQNLF